MADVTQSTELPRTRMAVCNLTSNRCRRLVLNRSVLEPMGRLVVFHEKMIDKTEMTTVGFGLDGFSGIFII
ncbi:hypothetical protein PoB_003206000 [Plakobranchus ocellatus]|uniref:Uncharacterized protein n=1 Tax=Plakobranchus ocellatus TaxID=259542 RepID=A0AAV4ADV2_9GAST|nr:hypothetical protein PoB_003206000 [Plakobranchus ocellatus]